MSTGGREYMREGDQLGGRACRREYTREGVHEGGREGVREGGNRRVEKLDIMCGAKTTYM